MSSRRVVLAALGVGGLAVAAAVAAVPVVLGGDDLPRGHGDLIAYGCEEPANDWYAVCVVRTDGTETRRLTSGVPTSEPAWSPDGRRIAFTSHAERGEYTKFAQNDIVVMDAAGDGPRQLTQTRFGRSSGEPAWSPDGSRIAFVRGSAVVDPGVTFGAIFVMEADGSGVRRLTSGPRDTDPSWSPDGREIAFARARAVPGAPLSGEIHVVSASGGTSRAFTRVAPAVASGPVWSPDGMRIAYVRTTVATPAVGGVALYVMNRDGTGARLLAQYRHYDRFPGNLTWSPDSRTLAFATSPSVDCTAIHLLDVASGAQRPLTTCAAGASTADSPSWQPASG